MGKPNWFTNKYVQLAVFTLLCLAVGFFIGRAFKPVGITNIAKNTATLVSIREKGQLTNPLLECDQAEDLFTELKPFKGKLQSLIDEAKSQNQAEFVSVYFRDLNNGPWFGINERENFNPGSLLKVPVMMAYLKLWEADPGILRKQLTVTPEDFKLQNDFLLPKEEMLEIGKTYTVQDLISRMIIYSDNISTQILIKNIDSSLIEKLYTDFGIDLQQVYQGPPQVTVKGYAGYFRVLFNASYLGRDASELALEILSRSNFQDGLVAGVPQGTTIAHKYGEKVYGDNLFQLHDCGIVYYPKHPYLLCVMTRGQNVDKLAQVVRNISTTVYNDINAQLQQ